MSDDEASTLHDEVDVLTDAIKPILAGADPNAVGCTLAMLVALYIAGHRTSSGEPNARAKFQEHITETWLEMLRGLIPLHNATIDHELKRSATGYRIVVFNDDDPKPREKPN